MAQSHDPQLDPHIFENLTRRTLVLAAQQIAGCSRCEQNSPRYAIPPHTHSKPEVVTWGLEYVNPAVDPRTKTNAPLERAAR